MGHYIDTTWWGKFGLVKSELIHFDAIDGRTLSWNGDINTNLGLKNNLVLQTRIICIGISNTTEYV